MGWNYATNRAKLHTAKYTQQMQKYLTKEMQKQWWEHATKDNLLLKNAASHRYRTICNHE